MKERIHNKTYPEHEVSGSSVFTKPFLVFLTCLLSSVASRADAGITYGELKPNVMSIRPDMGVGKFPDDVLREHVSPGPLKEVIRELNGVLDRLKQISDALKDMLKDIEPYMSKDDMNTLTVFIKYVDKLHDVYSIYSVLLKSKAGQVLPDDELLRIKNDIVRIRREFEEIMNRAKLLLPNKYLKGGILEDK